MSHASILTSSFNRISSVCFSSRFPPGGLIRQVAVGGFIVGHACLPNHWFHLGWLLLAGLFASFASHAPSSGSRSSPDPGVVLTSAFLLWMTLRSCWHGFNLPDEAYLGLFGAGLLALFCSLLWRQSAFDLSVRQIGLLLGLASSVAVLVSLYAASHGSSVLFPDQRLHNLLVHGGLNPVCTGLIFGFAATWLGTLVDRSSPPTIRYGIYAQIILLYHATFLSGSRGAVLASTCALVALLAAKGWRKGFVPPFAFLAIAALHLLWPLFLFEADAVSPPQGHSTPPPVPFAAALERGDNGRFDIYRAGWLAMDNLWLGTGQWGVRSLWQSHLHQSPDDMMTHLHSAFFATFVHGGIIGVGLLLALASLGFRRAWSLAVRGDATWFVLFSFGCAGLLFDGESLASLTTAPRFEGLLFWTPLIIALSKESKTSSPPSLAAPRPSCLPNVTAS